MQQASNQRPVPVTPAPNSANTPTQSCEPAEWRHADSKNPEGETVVNAEDREQVRRRLFTETMCDTPL